MYMFKLNLVFWRDLWLHARKTFPGRDQGDKLENDINGQSMGNLIYQPGGDGEENMIHLSRTVAATWYLDQTNQWEAVNIDRRNEALQHIRTGGFH